MKAAKEENEASSARRKAAFCVFIVFLCGSLLYTVMLRSHSLSTTLFGHDLSAASSSCQAPSGKELLGIYGSVAPEAQGLQITTKIVDSKRLFQQGMTQLWGFNYVEAARNFEASAVIDPTCALCFWGISLSYGSNINRFVEESDVVKGKQAIDAAVKLIEDNQSKGHDYTNFEVEMIRAQRSRWPASIDSWTKLGQDHFENLYETSIAEFQRKEIYDLDSAEGALLASMTVEARFNLDRWEYYDLETKSESFTKIHSSMNPEYHILRKTLREDMKLSKNLLRRVLDSKDFFKHPLALHLWIHLTEASHSPQDGLIEARILAREASGTGHLLHMPAHTFFRTGQYQECAEASIASIILDRTYTRQCLEPYCPGHNIALLVAGAMLSGNAELALKGIVKTGGGYLSPSALETDEMAATYITGLFPPARDIVLTRFGKFDDVLNLHKIEQQHHDKKELDKIDRELLRKSNQHRKALPINIVGNERPAYLKAIRLYTHALAVTNKQFRGKIVETDAVLMNPFEAVAAAEEAISQIPHDYEAYDIPSNHAFYPYHFEQGQFMNATLHASLAIQSSNNVDLAIQLLDEAVLLEDTMHYMEPEHWYIPMRHCLGSAIIYSYDKRKEKDGNSKQELLSTLKQAEQVYQVDLKHHPNNIWALRGLEMVYERMLYLIAQGPALNHVSNMLDKTVEAKRTANAHLTKRLTLGTCCEIGLC